MKKLFAAVVALCLVCAFAMPAAAADVKFSGEYYVGGAAWDKVDVRKDQGASDAFWYSKFRLGASFAIEEGVGAYVRGDIFDDYVWGSSNGSATMNFDYAWGWFNTAYGKFTIGQQPGGTYGTAWGDNWRRADKVTYEKKFGDFGLMAVVEKDDENDVNNNTVGVADDDRDFYYLIGNYKWDGGKAGVLTGYVRDASNSAPATSYKSNYYVIDPYMQANFGPVYVEAEALKYFGNEKEYEDGLTTPDVSLSGMSAYAMAKFDVGPAYVGAMFAYVQGDDPNTTDENELGPTGVNHDFGFILFNDEDWCDYMTVGAGPGSDTITTHGAGLGQNMGATNNDGAMGYGLVFGIAPTEALSINGALITAKADENNAAYTDDDYGMEFDIEASYKLFSSVTYTARFGYLWTGDYWKGTSSANEVDDIWMANHVISWKF